MEEKTTAIDLSAPPAYIMAPASSTYEKVHHSRRSKALFGYAVAITTALVVVLILGGVYYYRSLDVLQDTIRTYHISAKSGQSSANVDQDIEINTDKNTVVHYLSGNGFEPGTIQVLDYAKSMAGVYDPKSRKCYLLAGIRSGLDDPQILGDALDRNMNLTAEKTQYQVADDYPISDKSILPAVLKSPCLYLPVYWLEPIQEQKRIQKRRAAGVAVVYCHCCCCGRLEAAESLAVA